jgi:RNA polymerase sigma factor (sigma-70 family)
MLGCGHLIHQIQHIMKTFETKSDEVLISDILKGEADASGELYSRYYQKVYQKCLTLVKDPDEAFDLAEEALIKALNSLKSFRGDASFSTWLYIITHRHCLEFLRKKSKSHLVPLNPAQTDTYGSDRSDDSAAQHETEKIIMALVDKLPEDEKKLLLLKYSEGESIETLQNMFHLSPSAVKMRLKRSKERVYQLYLIATTLGLAEALSQLA